MSQDVTEIKALEGEKKTFRLELIHLKVLKVLNRICLFYFRCFFEDLFSTSRTRITWI